MKIAIVGSRDYAHLDHVREFVDTLPADTIVISGGARGVDRVAADAAHKRNLDVREFLPDWERYGRYMAPKVRNQQIADEADLVVAFWNGESTGTLDVTDRATQQGKRVIWL